MAVRPVDGNELVRSLKNRRLHILLENENDGAAVYDDIVDWIKYAPTVIQQNGPLTQADLDVMDYDKVWIDYGDDGEWALVVSGRIYALAVLEGAGFGDILRNEVDGETMDRPSGNYTVYRCPPEAKDNNVPTNEPLTIEELREMDGDPVWIVDVGPHKWYGPGWAIVDRDNCLVRTVKNWNAVFFESYGERWLAYRRPPEGEA